MEFLNNHLEITNNELDKLIAFTINSFKIHSKNGLSTLKAIDKTRISIWDEFIKINFIYHYKYHFEQVYQIYKISLSNYNVDKIDVIKSVLKYETHEEFLNSLKISKISNFIYGEDFDNIKYEDFFIHLLKYDVYHKCYNRLNENIDLYILFYETENYEEFTFKAFEGHVINSEIYRKQFSLFFPHKKIPVAIERLDDYENVIYDIVSDDKILAVPVTNRPTNKLYKHSNSEQSDNVNNNNLTLDEKSFLFYVMCKAISEENDKNDNRKDEFNLPYTELLRLISLIDFYDEKVFTEKYRDSNHYQILSKGLNHFKKENQMIFLRDLLKKIAEYKLPKTTKYINQIENKVATLATLNKK